MRGPSLDRLMCYCTEDGDCLRWTGYFTTDGLPCVMGRDEDGKRHSLRVRRVMYAHHRGLVPAGKNVIATCWNDWCVAPLHLQAVTKQEQMRQAAAQGRLFVPSRTLKQQEQKRATGKLDLQKVAEIRRRRVDGETLMAIAADFGVHFSLVGRICRGKAWSTTAPNSSVFNLQA